MALSDTKLRALQPKSSTYSKSDGGGLFIDVSPKGTKTWGLRYRLNGGQEKVGIGTYPAITLEEARKWRSDCKALAKRGLSPMALRRGDPIPEDAETAAKEMAVKFIADWYPVNVSKARAREEAIQAEEAKAEAIAKTADTVEAFAGRWFTEIAAPSNSNPRNIQRALEKDIIPAIGDKQLAAVTVDDVQAITDSIKARGADQMALQTRNILKRIFAYAIARQKITFNPAAALEAKYIASARSREVALSPEEVGKLLRAIYQSSIKRAHKLALHLLILCMVRKSELTQAKWEEIDFAKGEWSIPGERMKKDRPHWVPLSRQALAMFEELKGLACGSDWIFPSVGDPGRGLSHNTLNVAVRALDVDVRDFVIHDFRRTASTNLHEAGFNSDWIEKSLAHEQKGIRGVYNRAQYADRRREMLQWWADFVDSQIDEEKSNVVIGRFGKSYHAA